MKKYKVTIEPTTEVNASQSWGDKTNAMIANYPIRCTVYGLGGGYCRDFAEVDALLLKLTSTYCNHNYTPAYVTGRFGEWTLSVSNLLPTRTFYSVTYRNWGADRAGTAWFDSKTAADEFYYSRDHVDAPVAHRARSAQTIAKYQSLCKA